MRERDRKGGQPFTTYDQGFTKQEASSVFGASPVAGPEDLQRRQDVSGQVPTPVALPTNLFIPEGAQSVDISALANIPPNTTQTLLQYRGRKGSITRFIGYAVFNDALMLDLLTLVPKVNGIRVFPFHGNPQLKFKMGLGLGPDLSTLIPATLDLQPNDLITWEITNLDVVDISVGVRMSGYLDESTIRKIGRFGG